MFYHNNNEFQEFFRNDGFTHFHSGEKHGF